MVTAAAVAERKRKREKKKEWSPLFSSSSLSSPSLHSETRKKGKTQKARSGSAREERKKWEKILVHSLSLSLLSIITARARVLSDLISLSAKEIFGGDFFFLPLIFPFPRRPKCRDDRKEKGGKKIPW